MASVTPLDARLAATLIAFYLLQVSVGVGVTRKEGGVRVLPVSPQVTHSLHHCEAYCCPVATNVHRPLSMASWQVFGLGISKDITLEAELSESPG